MAQYAGPAIPVRHVASAVALFAPYLAEAAGERLCVAHLDGALALLHMTICPSGGEGSVRVPLRPILRDALDVGARALILAHNHPGGDPSPSRLDKTSTLRIVEVARSLDVRVIDHLVFAGDTVTSFRALALL